MKKIYQIEIRINEKTLEFETKQTVYDWIGYTPMNQWLDLRSEEGVEVHQNPDTLNQPKVFGTTGLVGRVTCDEEHLDYFLRKMPLILKQTFQKEYEQICQKQSYLHMMLQKIGHFPTPANRTLEDLGLSVRAYNVLKRGGLHTESELLNLSLQDLKEFRNMGRKNLQEIVAALHDEWWEEAWKIVQDETKQEVPLSVLIQQWKAGVRH